MSEGFETLGFLESIAAEDPGPLEKARLRSDAQERADAAADAEAKAEKEASRQARTEAMAILNRQAGDPLGAMSAAQQEIARSQDVVSDLRAQLEKAEGRLSRARSSLEWAAQRAQTQVHDVISRSWSAGPSGDPVEQATRRAHETFQQLTRAKWAEAQTRVPERRPFVSRGAGAGEGHAYSQHFGPMITRVCGPDDNGVLGNHAPELSR